MAMIQAQATPAEPGGKWVLPGLPSAIVYARNPLQRLKPEIEGVLDVPRCEADPRLAKTVGAWKKFCVDFDNMITGNTIHVDRMYIAAEAAIKGIECPAEDLKAFVSFLSGCEREKDFATKAGLFISALVNTGPSQTYVVETGHLSTRIDDLGYHNTRDIVVVGNVGHGIGSSMRGGTLTVKGNAEDSAGLCMMSGTLIIEANAGNEVGAYLSGGTVIVRGNVGMRAGFYMAGGVLTIEGSADDQVGFKMKKGEIHIGHRYGSIYHTTGNGKIFVGGVQVYPRLVSELVSKSVPDPNQEVA